MNPNNEENRRERFRVLFPTDSMLKASINGHDYDVVEVAELSIVVTAKHVLNENGNCSGSIVWSDGRTKEFIGELGRNNIHGRVIRIIKGITTQDIVKEQRRLLKKFPPTKNKSTLTEIGKPTIFQPDNE